VGFSVFEQQKAHGKKSLPWLPARHFRVSKRRPVLDSKIRHSVGSLFAKNIRWDVENVFPAPTP